MRIWMVKSKSDKSVSDTAKILFPRIEKMLILGKRNTIIIEIEILMVLFMAVPQTVPHLPQK